MAECPICLSSSDEHSANEIQFVKTSCNHVFCKSCVERALLKTIPASIESNGDENHHIRNDPTIGKCPMCRQHTSLFDLRQYRLNNQDGISASFIYAKNTEMSTWPIANLEYKQKRGRGSNEDAELMMEHAISEYGATEGYGIIFQFQGQVPKLEFQGPLRVVPVERWEFTRKGQDFSNAVGLTSATFDSYFYFEKTSTFHGKIRFEPPVSKRFDPKYFYDELDVLLQFAGNKSFVRNGYLHWRMATPQRCPLDGVWMVKWSNGNAVKVKVQNHYFVYSGMEYHIKLDEHNRPWFNWSNDDTGPKQTSDMQINLGSVGPGIGENLEWKTQVPGHETITWTRLSSPADLGHDFVSLKPTYVAACRKNDGQSEDSQFLIPVYHGDTLWGNVFCQEFCVGLASYHFELDSEGVFSPYISYEHPDTSKWPSLDNGMPIPARVPFQNPQWRPRMRIFRGDICWLEDFGTTWNNEAKWSYEMHFDQSFTFIKYGTCSRANGQYYQFGRDLVYINAALEDAIRLKIQYGQQSIEEYLVHATEHGASQATIQILHVVASAAAHDPHPEGRSIIDFNLAGEERISDADL